MWIDSPRGIRDQTYGPRQRLQHRPPGATILGITNRGSPIAHPVQPADGTWIEVDRTEALLSRFTEHRIDALIAIGGDGSLATASHLQEADQDTSR